MVEPSCTSPARSGKLIEACVSSPSIGEARRVKAVPFFRRTFPFLKEPRRISGPFVSSMVAMGRSSSSRRRTTRSSVFLCISWSPCEKLKRATAMPDRISSRKTLSSSVAGPIVQTIFVFLIQEHLLYGRKRPPRRPASRGRRKIQLFPHDSLAQDGLSPQGVESPKAGLQSLPFLWAIARKCRPFIR